MNKTGIFLCLLGIFILLTVSSEATEVPSGHKPTPCFECHGGTIGADAGEGECGYCHSYKLPAGGIDVTLMQTEHNPKICKACHIGKTMIDATEKEIFHSGHNAVNCTQCHTQDNFTVIKIKSNGFQCVSCHGNQVHGIHIKNLKKICSICHGSWAKDKVYIANSTSPSSSTSQQYFNLEGFTILSLIKKILNVILGVKL